MIIYGWGFYNRRDHQIVWGRCSHCNHTGYLKSYTATKYVSLYFIPVIPYGRVRVLSECPNCKHGGHLSVGEWKKLLVTELAPALENWRLQQDRESTLHALQATLRFQDPEGFAEVRDFARSRFPQDEEMLLQLGSGLATFGEFTTAQEVFLEASKLGGENEEIALKRAEASIAVAEVPKPQPPHRLLQSAPVAIVPMALLIALVAFLRAAFAADVENVWLVNGIDQPYTVQLNETQITLQPHQRVRRSLDYGNFEVHLVDPDLPIEPISGQIKANPLTRLTKAPVVLINPDRLALFYKQKVAYADRQDLADRNSTAEILIGESYYDVGPIDALWRETPSQITVSSSATISYRTGLQHLTEVSPVEAANWLYYQEDPARAVATLEQALRFYPTDAALLYTYVAIAPSAQSIAYLEGGLDARPVNLDWHRAYHETILRFGTDAQCEALKARYEALARGAPDDTALQYLASRLQDDDASARPYLARAVAGPQPCAFAYHSQSWRALLGGDFERALAEERKAVAIDPENFQFQSQLHHCQLALRRFDELEARDREILAEDPVNHDALAELVLIHVVTGRAETVADLILKAEKDARVQGNEALAASLREDLSVTAAIASGDAQAVRAALQAAEGPGWAAVRALYDDEYTQAWDALTTGDNPLLRNESALICVLATAATRGSTWPEALWTRLQEHLAAGSYDSRRLLKLLQAERPPSVEEVLVLSSGADHSAAVLTLLGLRFPEAQSAYFARAHALNFEPSAFQPLLDEIHRGAKL